jgi:hypothetical protein
MKWKPIFLLLGIAGTMLHCGCSDPEGISKVEAAFKGSQSQQYGQRAEELVKAARAGDYFTAVSGFQWLRGEKDLNVEQITALQDAIGKMQTQLAERAAKGDTNAQKYMRALQGETDRE